MSAVILEDSPSLRASLKQAGFTNAPRTLEVALERTILRSGQRLVTKFILQVLIHSAGGDLEETSASSSTLKQAGFTSTIGLCVQEAQLQGLSGECERAESDFQAQLCGPKFKYEQVVVGSQVGFSGPDRRHTIRGAVLKKLSASGEVLSCLSSSYQRESDCDRILIFRLKVFSESTLGCINRGVDHTLRNLDYESLKC